MFDKLPNITIGTTFPGEQALVAILNYNAVVRQTMNDENKAEFDKLNNQLLKVWVDMVVSVANTFKG